MGKYHHSHFIYVNNCVKLNTYWTICNKISQFYDILFYSIDWSNKIVLFVRYTCETQKKKSWNVISTLKMANVSKWKYLIQYWQQG